MTTKKKESTSEKKSRVKVGKLQLNKETVADLGDSKLKDVKGGLGGRTPDCYAGAKPDTGAACTEATCPGLACA